MLQSVTRKRYRLCIFFGKNVLSVKVYFDVFFEFNRDFIFSEWYIQFNIKRRDVYS